MKTTTETTMPTTAPTTMPTTAATTVIDGGWTTWGGWSDCDVTCGGGVQYRTRECSNPQPSDGGDPCAGNGTDSRACSLWDCPDCSRLCAVGTLDAACETCTCDNHVLYGHVTDTRNAPLEGCGVAFAEKPWEVATTTNATGRFVLVGACSQGVVIVVRRAGFFDEIANTTQVDSTTSSVRVRLRALVPPIIDENPVGKVRLVGQDVTFCCRAHGTPMPSYYEWFKDDRVLDQNFHQYNDTLTLYNVQVSDIGTYRCRANSEAGAKYSLGASLVVHANGTSLCNSTPKTKFIDLPDDCVQPDTNTTKYDIGACSREKCVGDLGNEDKDCLDTVKKFCCLSVASETRTVQCRDYSLEITVTTACGCGECVEGTKKVRGRAFGIKNGTEIPLEYGDIIKDGQVQGYTSQTGEFELDVPLTVDHVTITFKDFYKKLVTTTKVLPVEEGINQYLTVRMQVRPPATPLKASETSTISLGTLTDQPPLAEVDIPPNSFFTESGDPYTGTVQASVGFIDPRNPDDFDDIQSDLTTVDEEGTQQALRTFGMFSMDFEDDSGNPVVMGGKMTMHIDPQQININPFDVDENGNLNTKLWSLNPSSGEWELVGNLRVGTAKRRRKKRQATFFIGEFEYRGYPINCDKRETTDRRCWVKVRVYGDEDAAKSAGGQMTGAQVTVITIETPAYTSSWWGSSSGLSRYQTLSVGANGACVETFCEPSGAEFNASVLVSHGSNSYKVLRINDHPSVTNWPTNFKNSAEQKHNERTIVFDVFKPTTNNGPLYKYEDQSLCNNALIGHNHIAFYNAEYEPYSFPPYEFDDYETKTITPLSWYNREDMDKKVCFIKVRVLFSSQNSKVKIRTTSKGGGDYPPNSGKVYGIREDQTQTDSGNNLYGFTCVEFKCPGPIRSSCRPPGASCPVSGSPQDSTQLTVAIKNQRQCHYQHAQMSAELLNEVSDVNAGYYQVEFKVPFDENFDPDTGIYTWRGRQKTGYDSSREYCMKGSEAGTEHTMLNWGLEFRCYF
ncbi:CILP [Branchiostoma lanceolatum]|nr:CILP [Branchiostoma lanceolatum]